MNKLIVKIILIAGILFSFSACNQYRHNPTYCYDEELFKMPLNLSQRDEIQRKHQILSHLIIVEIDDVGNLRLNKKNMDKEEFFVEIEKIGREMPGMPILFSYNPDIKKVDPKYISQIVRACKKAKLGKVYTKIPLVLPRTNRV